MSPWNGRVNRQTSPEQEPAGQSDQIAKMTSEQRLIEAYHRAKLVPAFRDKLESLVSLESLAGMVIGFAVGFAIRGRQDDLSGNNPVSVSALAISHYSRIAPHEIRVYG